MRKFITIAAAAAVLAIPTVASAAARTATRQGAVGGRKLAQRLVAGPPLGQAWALNYFAPRTKLRPGRGPVGGCCLGWLPREARAVTTCQVGLAAPHVEPS